VVSDSQSGNIDYTSVTNIAVGDIYTGPDTSVRECRVSEVIALSDAVPDADMQAIDNNQMAYYGITA